MGGWGREAGFPNLLLLLCEALWGASDLENELQSGVRGRRRGGRWRSRRRRRWVGHRCRLGGCGRRRGLGRARRPRRLGLSRRGRALPLAATAAVAVRRLVRRGRRRVLRCSCLLHQSRQRQRQQRQQQEPHTAARRSRHVRLHPGKGWANIEFGCQSHARLWTGWRAGRMERDDGWGGGGWEWRQLNGRPLRG